MKPLYENPSPSIVSDKTACISEKTECETQANKTPTSGMNLGERIKHVGGRDSENGYVEFGSIMAVHALISHVLRDLGLDCANYQAILDGLDHIPDAGQMVVPYGYRLVSLADIDTAIQRASVFDDGGDGADPESARSCIEILKSMLKGDGTFIDEGTNITKLSLSIDTKKAQALLQSYLDNLKGWQLVPKEPTMGMYDAWLQGKDNERHYWDDVYKAMLAAAPKCT